MASDAPLDFLTILETLHTHQVEFILVGGLCAVAHGVPLVTTDVDIVHRRTSENIEKLLGALEELNAIHRYHPSKITPKESHLVGLGHSLLETKAGNLDVLGSIDDGRDYDVLLKVSVEFELEGAVFHMLALAELIAVKSRANRPKDRAVLHLLQDTLDFLNSRSLEEE